NKSLSIEHNLYSIKMKSSRAIQMIKEILITNKNHEYLTLY
ncbi:unnamed protein product, partial [Rotaria sp. Silwood2]